VSRKRFRRTIYCVNPPFLSDIPPDPWCHLHMALQGKRTVTNLISFPHNRQSLLHHCVSRGMRRGIAAIYQRIGNLGVLFHQRMDCQGSVRFADRLILGAATSLIGSRFRNG
jgi:hypothetical protein